MTCSAAPSGLHAPEKQRRQACPRHDPPPRGRRNLGIALIVIATAQLMVVLDATIVNVALPHIQRALGFSGTGLEWVVTAYALAFGGLLLLGGRAGDLLGRRRVFIAGLLLFSAASLAGGFATSQAWLLSARAVQGIGGAMIAPTALALVATTFAEGPARNRAMGVYAAMSGGGAAVGLVAGGLLTTYLSWRWVLFVNVPIGVLAAAAAPFVLPESARRRGRFDLPGAITGTAGVALLVYGLSSASTGQAGVSHWADPKVVASLAAAAVLLAAFVIIERRSSHPLMPLRILANRSRSGSYLIMLVLATAMFGLFFFLTMFVQDVLGYSALKAGVAFLPLAGTIVVVSGIASQLISRTGARPLMLAAPRSPPAACTGSPTSACTPPTSAGCSARSWSPGPAWECCSCRCHWWCSPASATRTPGWSPACSTPASRSAALSAWPLLAPWPGPRWPTAPAARSPRPRRRPAGPATRSRRSRAPRCPHRSTTTPSQRGSPAVCWSPPR